MSEAFSKAVVGFAGLVDVISTLENELKATKLVIESLDARIRYLENTQEADQGARFARVEERVRELEERSVLDSDLEDKVRDLIDGALEDAIDSALSGREIEINMTGTATL